MLFGAELTYVIVSAPVIRQLREHHQVWISSKSSEASILSHTGEFCPIYLAVCYLCFPGWARTTRWTWWPVRICLSVSGPHSWDQTSPPWMPWLPPAPTRQSSRASSTNARISSTISHWLTVSPDPPPLRCPPGEERQPTPAWLEATPPHRLRPRLPTSSLPHLLSFHTTAHPSTTTTITTTTITISISLHPTPHLLLPSPRSQPCCRPPCTPITLLRNNIRCEPGIKGKIRKEKKKRRRWDSKRFKGSGEEIWSLGRNWKR